MNLFHNIKFEEILKWHYTNLGTENLNLAYSLYVLSPNDALNFKHLICISTTEIPSFISHSVYGGKNEDNLRTHISRELY